MYPLPPRETDRLKALRSLDILGSAPEEHFDAVCRTARALFDLPVAVVSLVDEESQWFKARCGLDIDGTPRDAAFCTHAILSDDVLVIEDATRDERVHTSPLVTGRHGIRFYAGAPLTLEPGIRVGSLCVMDTKPRSFSSEQRRQLQDMARVVAAQLRLHEATRESIAAHEALQAMSERLHLAQECAGAGLFDWSLAENTAHLSPASLRHLGLPETRSPVVTLEEWAAAIHPDDLPKVRQETERALATCSTYRVEFRVPLPDGGERCVLGRGRVITDETGKPVRIAGISLDHTERLRAEEKLRASEAALRVSEERLALALDSGSDGLWDYDIVSNAAWISDNWSRMLGYVPGELKVDRSTWVHLLHPEDKPQALLRMREHLEGRAPTFECEYRLRNKDGGWTWILARGRVVAHDMAGAPLRIVGTHIDISARKAAERRATWMAGHDGLTELPNRVLFRECLDRQLRELGRRGGSSAVLFLDLDRFKAVNDTLGHLAGDALLREIAHRLKSTLRQGDIVARVGGDEFAVLLRRSNGSERAALVAGRLIEAVQAPVVLGTHDAEVGVSIGIAVIPTHGDEAEALLKHADLALYQAKAAGRNTFRFFEPAMEEEAESRLRLELDLRRALQRGEFELHYQPILDVASGTIVSAEALVRWRHPSRGLVPPSDFIPAAEEAGLIVPLGEWVLRAATDEARHWPEHVRVAVNVSTVQVRHGSLIPTVRAALDASLLAAERLELEITESVLMADDERASAVLHDLRGLGVHIALDDFGTGYSSLSYLRQFPFDKLKIDRSFVSTSSKVEAATIVRAVAALGRGLGMIVTAEGVETQEQFDMARAEGCTEVQGYLVGRPYPAGEELRMRLGQVPVRAARRTGGRRSRASRDAR
ncbi:EAL domain-containing protein [uncultured Methylobacterium sp.]|uniref:sensor domain-containing phosphodiesterase n=1 Tax=uncultured Methylobacterium sp. TaxID=157278 RepID=UPI00259A752E|nr:EAL domain-containing protein [uncultured Methylobacterium sp.]